MNRAKYGGDKVGWSDEGGGNRKFDKSNLVCKQPTNNGGFMKRVTTAAIIAIALAFTFGCSDDKSDNGGGTGKWCVYPDIWDESQINCGEIGAKLSSWGNTLTEEMCNNNFDNSSIMDEKQEGCRVTTD